jgi:hypothetical protein
MNKVKAMRNFSILIVSVLLLSSVQIGFASNVENRQLSDQPSNVPAQISDAVSVQSTKNLTDQQTFWLFLNNIAGINTTKYAVSMFQTSNLKASENSSKTQTAISTIINRGNENLSISMVLIGGKVSFYDLNLISGSLEGPSLSLDNCLSASKNILSNYQTLFGAAYCSQFNQLTPAAIQGKNATVSNENNVLSINQTDDIRNARFVELDWCKKVSGINVPSDG